MTYRKEVNLKGNPLNSIVGIIIMILFLIGLWYLAKFIFKLLFYLSPVMLIAALIIDKTVVTGYLQWVYRLFKKNVGYGIGVTVLSIIGLPVVSTFLLGKALFKKKIKDIEKQQRNIREGELIDYEELDSEPLKLPEIEPEKRQPRNKDTTYEDLFE